MSHVEQPLLFAMPQSGYTTDDYYTPKWIFDALGIEFDIDVACPPQGSPHTPCKHFYTQETDGLASPWWGTVWMNPPYSKPAPWVEKWLAHGDGIALLPLSKSKWFDLLWQKNETKVISLYSVKFERPEASMDGSIMFPLGLWGIGEKALEALEDSGLGKMR